MKNQIKKSLSLFMAVMMLLSCWVWVAPEKASADHTTGQYYVKYIVSNISEAGNNGKWSGNSMTINYTKNDGTKGTKSISLTKSNYTSTGTNKVIWEGYVDGFPNSIGWYMKMEWKAAASVYLNVRGAYFLVGKDAASCTNSVTSRDNEGGADCFKWQNNATGSGTKEATFTIYANSGDPYIASADVLSATTLDCPAWGTTTVNSTTAVQPTYWDQYGVKWLGAVDTTYFITDTATGTEDKGGQDKGIWTELNGKKGFVKINASMQENIMADENGKKDLYMIASATNSNGDEVNASQKITVSYSKVKYTFNANGSISGLGAKIYETKDKTKELGKDGTYAAEAYYGKEAIFPKNDSVFAGDGYTFLGFWTKAQPSTGDAYYYSKEADFAYPCTSAEYASYVAMVGAKEKDGVVTVAIEGEAKKFYDAGEKWDDKTKTVNGNKTYYGWWCSKDINIKFYDLDGKYLGADTVKYGQKGDAISWPKSDYTDKVFVSGAVSVKASAGKWVNKDGEAVSADNSYEFKHDLILTPATTAYNFDNAYTIVFMSEAGGELSKEEDYGYRATVTVPANREVPNAISSDPQFGYTFVGWTTVKPSKGNYHILLENSDFDDNGTAIPLVNDWIVRSDATYYPVYRKALKSYNVRFVYRDATGETVTKTIQVAYGSEIIPPVDDVPSKYATGGYEYSFLKWLYKNGENKDTESTYAQEITLSSENVNIPANALVGKNGAIVFQATYPESGTPTPYTVTFRSRNENGGVITQYFEVNHGDEITDDVVAKLAPATEYDNGEALVSFMNKWTVIEGAAGKEDPYSTEELKTFSPTSHITFEAVYGNPQNFYTVTYIDGTQSYSERVLVGSNLPAWMVSETEAYTPSKESDEKGDYVFAGWYDEKQTDTTFAATNGNKYEETSEITSNVTLYPQFKFEAKKYTITFLDYEGKKQLATYKFEYGLNIEWLIAEAQMAAKARSADETYEYEFIGWDKVVPATCEGKDMTFTAQYKATYKYYDAKWYNSKLEDGKWVADKATLEVDGKTVETYLLDTTHHTYNSKVYAPSVKTECKVAAPDGQTYVFAGWYYKDKDGNEKAYQRGMLITAEMEFYATYTLTSKVYTVTTVVKGEETPYSVAAGNAAIIPDPQAGYVNEVLHDSFAGWYTDEEFKSEFSLDTVITSNLKLYAKFEQSLHNNSELKKVISAPTYYAAGVQEIWCSCSYENTKETVEFPALTDTVKPTGTIYLGKNKWSTSDDVGAAATDNYPVEIYANANTDIIITANDKGDVNELYNPSGSGKGIRLIRAFAFPADMVLTADSYSVAASVAENVFVDTTEELTNVANFTVRLGDFEIADLAIKTDTEGNIVYDKNGKEEYVVQYNDDGSIKTKPLVSGETYIIYYTIIDKANNQQNTKVRTAKFIYDAEGPEFTITGKKNSNEAYPTYCETATITNIEADATLAINGKAVTIEEGTNSYTITKAGNYLITVTDIAGNSVSKKIKIAAEHVYSTSEKAVICTEDGYYKEECINCGDKKTDVKYIAEGHDMGETKTVEPTCKSHGYKVTECKNCDYVDRVEYQLNTDGSYALDENGEKIPVFPAVDHDYTGAEYKVAIAPTCTTEGLEEAFCTECGEGRVTRTIEIDTSAHKLGTLKTLEATCESAGYKYRVCKLCNKTIEEAGSGVAALGHSTENKNWVVT
ncbi:MAG: InlB B-repeat-containing protein, partial [Clostridia bacterium]|nr:InlB B-repeat-containing protein [Clostridia bacterium]